MNIYGGPAAGVALGKFQQLQGSDFSGSDGDSNRTVTLTNTPLTSGTALIYINGRLIHKTQEYSISGSVLTIIGALYDNSYIDVWY